MNFRRLLWENLRFHWRGNLAVLLGVAVGTAVLTGALLVGDSLKGSLRDLSERRLGWVDHVLVTGRFFREDLVRHDLATAHLQAVYEHKDELKRGDRLSMPVPAILVQGAARAGKEDGDLARRVGHVTVWGVEADFWQETQYGTQGGLLESIKDRINPPPMETLKSLKGGPWDTSWFSANEDVVLNAPLAAELGVKVGDTITLNVGKGSPVPRESLLGRRDGADVVAPIPLTVRAVLPPDNFPGSLSLAPTSAEPLNAFIPLRTLQEKLGLKGKVNAVLVGGPLYNLDAALGKGLTLDDWGLVLHTPEERTRALFDKLDRDRDGKLSRAEWRDHVARVLSDRADPKTGVLSKEAVRKYYEDRGYLSLESKQMLLDDALVPAINAAAKDSELFRSPTLVYLANSIANERLEIGAAIAALDPAPLSGLRLAMAPGSRVPYSVVAALDPMKPPPLTVFRIPYRYQHGSFDDGAIVVADWPGSPLNPRPGDTFALTYFQPEQEGRLEERTARFRVIGAVKIDGPRNDPDLTPEFPGITDKLTLTDWDPPFPYDNKRVRKRDEDYWKLYRTTPKAYITLEAGQKLWGSRFGKLTSVRMAPEKGGDLEAAANRFRTKLLATLRPEQGGFVFDNVRQRGLEASAGGTDFSQLFLGFSFFLIAAALLLVGLLFRLNLDRRAPEIGLLLALGYRRRTLRRLLLVEGAVLSLVGGPLGVLLAVAYAWGLLELLRAWWPGTLDRSFLRLHVDPQSLAIGYSSAVFVSMLAIIWAVRGLGRVSPRGLLAGEAEEASGTGKKRGWAGWVAIGLLLLGLVLVGVGGRMPDHEARAGTFFSGGFCLLGAGLCALWALLRRGQFRFSPISPRLDVFALGIRNASRHPVRSLLTAGLLASAAFLIVAVESFRRQPERDFLNKHSGSGGFTLLAESDVPIYQDLNSGPGRDELNDALERRHVTDDKLAGVSFTALRLRRGDDASCLNLYEPRRPRLLGVPPSLIARGGFQFAKTLAETPEDRANPWRLLTEKQGDAIPVFGEANTVAWMLKSKLGGELKVPDEQGKLVPLRIVGLLQDSIFQGELLMSEANFLKLYPGQEGYNFFLIDAPADRAGDVKLLVENALSDRGFEVTPTATRLESYLAVENTYLSTFQALGGLGLLLGALGLAVVLLRSVWERRAELALLRALGFRRSMLGWLMLAENAFLLAVGLGIGTVAALVAVAPHVFGEGVQVPWLRLLLMLALVLLVGLAAGAAAMAATVRAPLVPALRRE